MGLYGLKKHFHQEQHFRSDQRFRASNPYPSTVRGSDGPTLYGTKLEAGKELLMHLKVSDLDHKCPFYYDVVEGKPFTFSSKSSRVVMHIELLPNFLKECGQL